MSADRFIPSVDFVLRHECVFEPGHGGDLNHVVAENVPGDSGGLTKFGIDQSSHPNVNICALTLEDAVNIYRREEWTKCRCDDLPAGLDTIVFDTAVNMGMGTAVRQLQIAINRAFPSFLIVDGQIGPKTIAAAHLATGDSVPITYLAWREQHYRDLAEIPSRARFLTGWLNRVNDLRAFIGLPKGEEKKS